MRSQGDWQPVLATVEGTPADEWPASPPFQSLHVEARDDGRTLALLVGMAGHSHWSASVEIDAAARCVRFDVAARVRTHRPGPLTSSYRTTAAQRDPHTALRVEPGQRFGPTHLEQSGEQIAIVARSTSDECPQTVRWDYRLQAVTAD